MRIDAQAKTKLLRELALDLDWNAAAKRAGITQTQLNNLKNNEKFMKLSETILKNAMKVNSGVDETLAKFRRTQEILSKELEGGNMNVAAALIRSHELEFRQHGLFEKDNSQKSQAVQISINLQTPVHKTIDGVLKDVKKQ